MSDISSGYHFPIFVSSTVYNLIDLRAELKRYLAELGYDPFLSDGEGFQDSSPDMAPYESCLKVLGASFAMVLIIDGKYGAPFKWSNWEKVIEGREVSPTHAEYLYAIKNKMRMFVFIRREAMFYYQVFRQALRQSKNETEAKDILSKVLPADKRIDYETLKFIHEIKTTEPIWIKEFDDVTDIKTELKKKMLNELAEQYLIKTQHLESIKIALNKALGKMTSDERTKYLSEIGYTKDLISQIDQQAESLKELAAKNESLHKKLKEKDIEVEKGIATNNVNKKILKEKELITAEINNTGRLINSYLANQDNLLYGSVSMPSLVASQVLMDSNSLLTNTVYTMPGSVPLHYAGTGSIFYPKNETSPIFYPSPATISVHDLPDNLFLKEMKENQDHPILKEMKSLEDNPLLKEMKTLEDNPILKEMKRSNKK